MPTHNHAPWRKSILIPCWVLQLFLELLMIIVFGIAIGIYSKTNSETIETNSNLSTEYYPNYLIERQTTHKIVIPIHIAIVAVCLILTIIEIILLAQHLLRPFTFLLMNGLKTTIWTGLLIWHIVDLVSPWIHYSGNSVSFILDAVFFLILWPPFIYGCRVYHLSLQHDISYPAADPTETVVAHVSAPVAHNDYNGYYKQRSIAQDPGNVEHPDVFDAAGSYNRERETRAEEFGLSRSIRNGDRLVSRQQVPVDEGTNYDAQVSGMRDRVQYR